MPRFTDALARLWPRRTDEIVSVKASATGPLIAFETLGRPVWTPRDYQAFAREGFMQNAIVYRSVRMIAEAASSIPVLLYERDQEIEEHPLLDLIARPSPDHTSADFFEAWYGFLLVAGNAYVEAVAAGGRLRELHVLRPDRMKVVPGPEGWPEAYEYTAGGSTVRFDEEPVPSVRPILHVRLFHPANDHYGMSPIEAAAAAIDLHNTAAHWNKALLDNSARPSGALVYGGGGDGRMTAEQFGRLKTELEQGFQGAKQAGRPLLLEGGLDWKPLGLSPKDMDFVEARHGAAREIALALGVPPMLLGIPGDNTFPAFPYNTDVWGDGENWRLGHWLNGRFASGDLSGTVERLLADYGFQAHETKRLAGTVGGYVVDRVMSPRDALQPLELAHFFDSVESGGQIVFRHRGSEAPVLALSEDDLVEERPGDALLTLTRGQETELPASAKISYIASAGDYRQAIAEARRLTGASGRIAQAELPMVFEPEHASEIANSWLFETWVARERASFKLPPSALGVEPGDAVTIEKDGIGRLFRLTEVGEHGVREIEARALDPDVYGGVVTSPRVTLPEKPPLIGQPAVELMDLPLLRGDEPPQAGYVAAFQSPWPGGVAIYSSPETSGYVLRAVATAPATMGTTLDAMANGVTGVMDRATRFRVQLYDGELTSVTHLQMLAGGNSAAVRNADGEWEVFQFETATLVAPLTYELSGLLRGQAGTELAMRSPLPAGAMFVLLTNEIARVSLAPDEIRLPLNWRCGPSSRDIGDASYVDTAHAFAGAGLRPLAPVHIRGTRASGDLAIGWIRRTRIGGDAWGEGDVPLAEESERYEVDILAGSIVKRTLAATSPSVTYSAAQQVADFGAPQASVSVKVYQVGAAYGRGSAAAAVI